MVALELRPYKVAAQTAGPAMKERRGQVLTAGDLPPACGFTGVDGWQPPAFRTEEEYLCDWDLAWRLLRPAYSPCSMRFKS